MTDKGTTPGPGAAGADPSIAFLLDDNLGLPVREAPWTEILPAAGIVARTSTDLAAIDAMIARHEPDVAYMPIADYHRFFARGDRHYRGLAIATSKFTGLAKLPSVLVVRRDDPATGLDDLGGAEYGIINRSCSSSFFPPAILLAAQGKKVDDFLRIKAVAPWQGQIDAVVAGRVRATMVPEDVWKTNPGNARVAKVVGRYDTATPPVVVARHGLPEAPRRALLDALLAWTPRWEAVYGAFRPFYYADVHAFFHDLDGLPRDL